MIKNFGSTILTVCACFLISESDTAIGQTIPVNNINMNGSNQAAAQSWSDSWSSSQATGGTATASNSGNHQTVNVNSTGGNTGTGGIPDYAPNVMLPSMFPTSPCQATVAGGFSAFIFGGLAGGMSYTLEQCEMREEARIAYSIGQHAMAKEILCMAKYAAQTKQCRDE